MSRALEKFFLVATEACREEYSLGDKTSSYYNDLGEKLLEKKKEHQEEGGALNYGPHTSILD